MNNALPARSATAQENPVAFVVALLLALGAAIWTTTEFVRDWRGTLPPEAVTFHLQAAQPENGGWLGDLSRIVAGQPVRLIVKGMEGSHAFAIGYTSITSPLILPGQEKIVAFTAPEPGRYVLYCTQWCSPDHWRMRTVLEVTDPENPNAALAYTQEAQRYQLPLGQMDIDAPHPAAIWPVERANAAAGAALWERIWPDQSPVEVAEALEWPLASPAQVYQRSNAEVSERDRWDAVAYLWRAQTTPQALAQGTALYNQNCASCHGETGAGDGFAASFAPVAVPDFTDATIAAGASPALYYAKIARGGMGTGMPNWGTIFREGELWSLVDYLYTFMFDGNQ